MPDWLLDFCARISVGIAVGTSEVAIRTSAKTLWSKPALHQNHTKNQIRTKTAPSLLRKNPQGSNMLEMSSVLFYTIGLPGAGKTTFAASLSNWLGAVNISDAKVALELFRFPTYSPREMKLVHTEMAKRAAKALQAGRHVVFDASMNSREQRRQLNAFAQNHGCKAIGIWLDAPLALAMSRAGKARTSLSGAVSRVVPPKLFEHYAAKFEAPTQDETTLIIPGDTSFPVQYHQLSRHLRALQIRLPRLV